MEDYSTDQLNSIVSRFNAGDQGAKDELIQLTFQRLHALAKKMLKRFPTVRRWEETDDIFQRATMRLLKSLEQVGLCDERHFLNLAALQIRRELIEIARSIDGPHGINRNTDSTDKSHLAPDSPFSNPMSETHEASSLAIWTDFHQSVDNLDDEHREVFELMWYQGLSQESVAELLKVSQSTIARRWQKARRSVHDLMSGQLPE